MDPKDDEEDDDDIKKIIDDAKQREIQEAEDLKLAMQLSQEMNDDNGLEEGSVKFKVTSKQIYSKFHCIFYCLNTLKSRVVVGTGAYGPAEIL